MTSSVLNDSDKRFDTVTFRHILFFAVVERWPVSCSQLCEATAYDAVIHD